jgi:hypothetical protein
MKFLGIETLRQLVENKSQQINTEKISKFTHDFEHFRKEGCPPTCL